MTTQIHYKYYFLVIQFRQGLFIQRVFPLCPGSHFFLPLCVQTRDLSLGLPWILRRTVLPPPFLITKCQLTHTRVHASTHVQVFSAGFVKKQPLDQNCLVIASSPGDSSQCQYLLIVRKSLKLQSRAKCFAGTFLVAPPKTDWMAHALIFQEHRRVRKPLGGAWHQLHQESVVNEPKTVRNKPKVGHVKQKVSEAFKFPVGQF